ARKLDQSRSAAATGPKLMPVPRDGDLPLSFPQQQMWYLHQLEPDSPAYHISCAVRLCGPLRAASLSRALDEIIQRHESLRTRFALSEGRPVQRIGPPFHLDLAPLDVAPDPAGTRPERVHDLALRFSQEPFDLSRGPLIRAKLLVLGAQ